MLSHIKLFALLFVFSLGLSACLSNPSKPEQITSGVTFDYMDKQLKKYLMVERVRLAVRGSGPKALNFKVENQGNSEIILGVKPIWYDRDGRAIEAIYRLSQLYRLPAGKKANVNLEAITTSASEVDVELYSFGEMPTELVD